MKKILAVIAAVTILASIFAGFTISASAFNEYYDYVTFTATGDDPYAVFKFGSKGQYKKIDPDVVAYAVVRYRTRSEKDNEGEYYKGQFYIMPFDEPFIPIEYKFTGQWETVVVDLLTVSDDTMLDSKWDSDHYTTRNMIRFDPLESSRDAENNADEYDAEVDAGAEIDIAWIAFFEKEEDAKNYWGQESVTPYCVLGPGALAKLQQPINNLEVTRHTLDTPEPGHETPTPEPTETPVVTETPEPTEPPTQVPTAEPTEVPTDAPTQGAEKTPEAEPTAKPVETQNNSGSDDNGGCGTVIGGGIALAAAAALVLLIRKKH